MYKLQIILLLLMLLLILCGCIPKTELLLPETTQPIVIEPKPVIPETTAPETTVPETTVPETTVPEHSEVYIPGVAVEDVIVWFNEVALDTEYSYGGDATLVQKWTVPIVYSLEGNATGEDLQVLEDFAAWLNTLAGFPGIRRAEIGEYVNLRIRFGDSQMILDTLGEDYVNVDGGVRYWYDDNAIYDAVICYRDDISQYTRNSVILEEIYNGLGLVQDTALRD